MGDIYLDMNGEKLRKTAIAIGRQQGTLALIDLCKHRNYSAYCKKISPKLHDTEQGRKTILYLLCALLTFYAKMNKSPLSF